MLPAQLAGPGAVEVAEGGEDTIIILLALHLQVAAPGPGPVDRRLIGRRLGNTLQVDVGPDVDTEGTGDHIQSEVAQVRGPVCLQVDAGKLCPSFIGVLRVDRDLVAG